MSTRITPAPGTNSDSKYEAWEFNPAQISAVWEELEPLVMRALEHSHGELSVEDVKIMLTRGVLSALATALDGKIQLLLVVELVQWPQYKSVRIVLAAGKGLREAAKFLPAFSAWAMCRGAVELEAWCRPAMARLLRHLKFCKAYEVVRFDLRGNLQ